MSEVTIKIDYESVFIPAFHHLLDDDDDIDIELIWGGRDSGKSKQVAMLFTDMSLRLPYFRGLLIKQTHESIKDAQWQMIKDTAEAWGVDFLYKFKTSPLEIHCQNRNTMHARGMDNPAKIRSFTNPSHAWMEEANQTTEEGFINVITGLRSDYGRVKLYMTFNPEAKGDFEEFWLYKMFFKGKNELNFTSVIEIPVVINGVQEVVKLKYRSTHVTYDKNPYITPQRIAFHENLKTTNPYYYRIFTLGLWGNITNDNPWLFAWDRNRHIASDAIHPKRTEILFLSFDFNRNPHACTVLQWYNNTIYIIDVIKEKNVGTEGICEIVRERYPGFLYMVTGDYAGDTVSSIYKEQVSNYTVIKSMLRIGKGQLRISPNPRLEKNRVLVNKVFNVYNVQVCPIKAKPFIYDAENVRQRADGTIIKEDRNDPSQQADVLDTVRYFLNQFFQFILKM